MKMLKRGFALLLLMVVGFGLAACGGGGSEAGSDETTETEGSETTAATEAGTGEDLELTMWILSENAEGLDTIIASFEADHPGITITPTLLSVDSLRQNLRISASSDTLPTFWFNWGGELADFYVRNGLTYDLSDFAAANNWDHQFDAAAMELATLSGQLAGYPIAMNGLGVYYNRQIFADLGLEAPTTMDEFHEVVSTIAEAGITPISTAGTHGWHAMRFLEQLISHYAGPEQHYQLNTLAIDWEDNDAVISAFRTFGEYADNGYMPEGFVSMGPEDLTILFFSGQAAMQIEGQWFDGVILGNDQDMDDFGVFPFPSGEGNNRISGFVEMFQFNANLSQAEVEATVAFLDYYFAAHNVEAFPGDYSLPVPQYGRADEVPAELVNVIPIMTYMSENGAFTITDQALPTEVLDAFFNAQDSVALGTMTPEEAAASIQRAIEEFRASDDD